MNKKRVTLYKYLLINTYIVNGGQILESYSCTARRQSARRAERPENTANFENKPCAHYRKSYRCFATAEIHKAPIRSRAFSRSFACPPCTAVAGGSLRSAHKRPLQRARGFYNSGSETKIQRIVCLVDGRTDKTDDKWAELNCTTQCSCRIGSKKHLPTNRFERNLP